MKYDSDKVMPANPTVDFFNEHAFEIIGTCMQLQPKIQGVNKDQLLKIRFEAMGIVARKHEFGKYRHLCKTCYKDPETCNADPMLGFLDDNVCFCLDYNGELTPETVSKGLSGLD